MLIIPDDNFQASDRKYSVHIVVWTQCLRDIFKLNMSLKYTCYCLDNIVIAQCGLCNDYL